jgi:hypothetical protein
MIYQLHLPHSSGQVIEGFGGELPLEITRIQGPTDLAEGRIFTRCRQRVPDILPAVVSFIRDRLLSLSHCQTAAGLIPRTGTRATSQHPVISFRQHPQQVPCFNRMQLHRRRGGQQLAFCPRPQPEQEFHQIVAFGRHIQFLCAGFDLRQIPSSGAVRFVNDHARVPARQQLRQRFLHAPRDESLRHEANPPRTAAQRSRSIARVFDVVLVDPRTACPPSRRHVQKFHQFPCHCCSSGLGASTRIGSPPGSSMAISSAAIAS